MPLPEENDASRAVTSCPRALTSPPPAASRLSQYTLVPAATVNELGTNALPWIKTNAVYILTRVYKTEDEARKGIATALAEKYPNEPRIQPAIAAIQQIYADNFFPEMKANC